MPGRYASALFDLAREEKSVDRVAEGLSRFESALNQSSDLQRMVASPVFSSEDQLAAVEAIAAKLGIEGTALNFLKLVTKNNRLAAIGEMIKAYRKLVAVSRGEAAAEVTSAEPLSTKHVDELRQALKATMGHDVQISTSVDATILGGLIVKVGSRMMDNSLKTKLQNLKISMKGTG